MKILNKINWIFVLIIAALACCILVFALVGMSYGATLAKFPNDKELAAALDAKSDQAVKELKAIFNQSQANAFYNKMVIAQKPEEVVERLGQAKELLLAAGVQETAPVLVEIDKVLSTSIEVLRAATVSGVP